MMQETPIGPEEARKKVAEGNDLRIGEFIRKINFHVSNHYTPGSPVVIARLLATCEVSEANISKIQSVFERAGWHKVSMVGTYDGFLGLYYSVTLLDRVAATL